MGHKNDGGGLVGGEVPLEIIFGPEDPLGIDRGGGLRYGISNHFFYQKGVNDKKMGQFSLLEKTGEPRRCDLSADCRR